MRRLVLALFVLCACGIGPAPLPTASADVGTTHVSLQRGSYCWSSWGKATCADSAPPDMLLQSGYLKPISAAAGTRVKVTFSSQPSHASVALEFTEVASGASFTLLDEPRLYIYVITGKWQEGDVGFFLPVDVTR